MAGLLIVIGVGYLLAGWALADALDARKGDAWLMLILWPLVIASAGVGLFKDRFL